MLGQDDRLSPSSDHMAVVTGRSAARDRCHEVCHFTLAGFSTILYNIIQTEYEWQKRPKCPRAYLSVLAV